MKNFLSIRLLLILFSFVITFASFASPVEAEVDVCITTPFHTCSEASPPCHIWSQDADHRCLEVNTAFGPLKTDTNGFIGVVSGILLGASGSIGLLLIMRAGYRIMTARGNPEGIKEGREQLVAVILGMIFLIFAFVFLQIIGYDLLQIPGWTAN